MLLIFEGVCNHELHLQISLAACECPRIIAILWQSYLVVSWRTVMSMIIYVWVSNYTLHFPATDVGIILLKIGLRQAHNLEKATGTVPWTGYDNSHTYTPL